jgi:hypothetical protein
MLCGWSNSTWSSKSLEIVPSSSSYIIIGSTYYIETLRSSWGLFRDSFLWVLFFKISQEVVQNVIFFLAVRLEIKLIKLSQYMHSYGALSKGQVSPNVSSPTSNQYYFLIIIFFLKISIKNSN